MAIRRTDPLADLMQLKQRMNRLFEETLSRAAGPDRDGMAAGDGWQPPLDFIEQADCYVLRADLPGVDPAEIEVEVDNGTLILRGERRMDPSIPAESYLRVERPYGRFAVQIALPDSVSADSIEAVHRSGVIEVILPKRRREPTRSRITVDGR